MKLKITLICTIKNEQETIAALIDSVIEQTRSPDEFVIVDGGSSDNTLEILRQYSDKLPLRLIVSPGVNIAEGRNIAIKNTRHSIVACTDGGCVLHPNWLQNIVAPFELNSKTDVVSGVWAPLVENEFEEIISYFVFPNLDTLRADTFLPSTRSIAFKKIVWKKIGGFPEWLTTAEDTVFDLNLQKVGATFCLKKNAIVHWRIRSTSRALFKQFYNYGKGDGLAFTFFFRYAFRYFFIFIFFWLVLTNLFYGFLGFFVIGGSLFWIKYFSKVKRRSLKRLLISLKVVLMLELGLIFGHLTGIGKRLKLALIH